MEYQEGRFLTFDNLSLYEQNWRPKLSAKAVIVIIHGSFEHSGRYINLASNLVSSGYAVYSFDLRGHGKSDGERAFIPSFDALLKDLENFLKLVREREPDKLIFLLGHSVGGSIALAFLADHRPNDIRGLILSAPTLKFSDGVSFIFRNCSTLLSPFFPRLKLDKLNARFLSRDQAVVCAYNNDPLVYREGLSCSVAAEFIRSISKIHSKMTEISLPTLILHGTDDRISDIKGSKRLYARLDVSDKTLYLYDNFYHELFNEPGKEKVFSDIVSWLDVRSIS